MVGRCLIYERFDDRTVSKRCGLPRRIETVLHRQDDNIQKRTLFKPNDCVVHPEAYALLKFLMELSINPILFISCSVHHGPLGRWAAGPLKRILKKIDGAQPSADIFIMQSLDIERHFMG